jgi:single-strand DNA-binding protein
MAFDRRAVSLAQNVVQSTWPLVHDAVLWRQLADFPVNFMAKGRPVYVEGRLQTRTWDAADGTKRRTVEVVADRFQALSSRRTAEAA